MALNAAFPRFFFLIGTPLALGFEEHFFEFGSRIAEGRHFLLRSPAFSLAFLANLAVQKHRLGNPPGPQPIPKARSARRAVVVPVLIRP